MRVHGVREQVVEGLTVAWQKWAVLDVLFLGVRSVIGETFHSGGWGEGDDFVGAWAEYLVPELEKLLFSFAFKNVIHVREKMLKLHVPRVFDAHFGVGRGRTFLLEREVMVQRGREWTQARRLGDLHVLRDIGIARRNRVFFGVHSDRVFLETNFSYFQLHLRYGRANNFVEEPNPCYFQQFLSQNVIFNL